MITGRTHRWKNGLFAAFSLYILLTCHSVSASPEDDDSRSVQFPSEAVMGSMPEARAVGLDETDGDTLTVEDELENNDHTINTNVFEPSKEWKIIEEGQSIPAGLHVRMDLQTGLKEAKLLEEENDDSVTDKESVQFSYDVATSLQPDAEKDREFNIDSRRSHHYGNSDRRGVVNKRTKVFSKKEITEMLQKLNDDSVDFSNLPGITSSSPVSEAPLPVDRTRGDSKHEASSEAKLTLHNSEEQPRTHLPLSLHGDVEKMLEHSQTLANESASVSDIQYALEELEFHVHQIDNANDLNVIGGLVLVIRLLNHTDPEVRSRAAHVLGSATQSNPMVQDQVLEYGGLSLLCKLLPASEPALVRRRALFALSSLLRGNVPQQLVFVEGCKGLQLLGNDFEESSPQLQVKAVVLLTDILNEEIITDEAAAQLHTLLLKQVVQFGWCKHVTTLVHQTQLDKIEKGLLAMSALRDVCKFTRQRARLQELVKRLETEPEKQDEWDLGDHEYANNLLEHCRNLLKDIRKQNLDL